MKFATFAKIAKSDSDTLRELINEIERLSNLCHDEDQTNHALCTVLWSAGEGNDCALHVQVKKGIENVYLKAVEALMD